MMDEEFYFDPEPELESFGSLTTWIQKAGQPIYITDMSDEHLKNAISCRNGDRVCALIEEQILRLIRQLENLSCTVNLMKKG